MATPVHVQQWGTFNGGTASSFTATSGSAVTTGNAVLVAVSIKNNRTVTVTDGTNTYTASAATYDATLNFSLQLFYCLNVTAGSTLTITATLSSASDSIRLYCHEVSNLSAFDGWNVNHAASGSIAAGAVTPTVSGDFVLGAAINNNGTAGGTTAGWTAGLTEGSETTEYRVYASTAALDVGYTADGGPWVAGIMAFKPSGAAPASTPAPFLMLLGCGS